MKLLVLETLGDQSKAPHLRKTFDKDDDRPRLFHSMSTCFLTLTLQQSSNDKKLPAASSILLSRPGIVRKTAMHANLICANIHEMVKWS